LYSNPCIYFCKRLSRDNLSTVIVKAFSQTGLFDFVPTTETKIGIALSKNLSDVLQRRLRHILDTDLVHADPETNWIKFMASHQNDLPLEVEQETFMNEVDVASIEDISSLCADASLAFTEAGLIFSENLIRRSVSALLTKRFLILTGLSGSGKTKLAHAFVTWISQSIGYTDPFSPGNPSEGQFVTLPRGLIKEWADYIEKNDINRDMPAQPMRELIKPASRYGMQMNSFETHLKPAAFALLDSRKEVVNIECYRLVPVGADWTSNENVLG
jgi:hypothetical protein